nr:hypothetical protein [Gemmatimonadota bacterium]
GRIRQSDANRRRYIRDHFDREWLDPTLYHICVDVGRLGMETGAEIIADTATRYFSSLPTRRPRAHGPNLPCSP